MPDPRTTRRLIGAGMLAAAAAAVLTGRDRGSTHSSLGPGPVVLVGHGTSLEPPASRVTVRPDPHPRRPSAGGEFSIGGGATGLYPGVTLPLVLTVSNPDGSRITVVSISTTVGDASGACPASYASVSAFSGHVRVPARGTATVTVSAALAHSAPDACQGAVFPFLYSGEATRP